MQHIQCSLYRCLLNSLVTVVWKLPQRVLSCLNKVHGWMAESSSSSLKLLMKSPGWNPCRIRTGSISMTSPELKVVLIRSQSPSVKEHIYIPSSTVHRRECIGVWNYRITSVKQYRIYVLAWNSYHWCILRLKHVPHYDFSHGTTGFQGKGRNHYFSLISVILIIFAWSHGKTQQLGESKWAELGQGSWKPKNDDGKRRRDGRARW